MEMVPDGDQATPEYRAVALRQPGGSVTCAYCQAALEYDANGEDLVRSTRSPLRYSRLKTEDRAQRYGVVFMNRTDATPEEWLAHDKGMRGALKAYRYAEDP
jgi:hypothetical protein